MRLLRFLHPALLVLLVSALHSHADVGSPGFARQNPGNLVRLTVVYTANSSGKLTACGCPGDPYGGLAERATLLKRLREKEKPFLLLDAGNMVSLFGDFSERAACVMRLMNLMGYDAAGVGRQEMFRNIPSARAMSRAADFPFLSAAIADKSGAQPVFTPSVIKSIGGVRVGITSVCDSTAYIPDINRAFDYSVLPLDKALKPVLAAMEGKTDCIVVLSQMDTPDNEKLLRMYPSIDLVIEGYGNRALEKPLSVAASRERKNVSSGYIVSPGGRGQYVGLITLEKNGSSPPDMKRSELFEVLDIPADKRANDIIRAYYRAPQRVH
jgi:2',3'-cyclic-nucleotide 2'-phosphodiesterase (5'-nucleotidase family)